MCPLADLDDVAGIDFTGDRLLNQVDRQDEAVDTLFLEQGPTQSSEWPSNDFDAVSCLEIRIGIIG